jgi:estrogen-related receptor beta like 1
MIKTQSQLTNLHKDIEAALEKISSREKYINGQFDDQVNKC